MKSVLRLSAVAFACGVLVACGQPSEQSLLGSAQRYIDKHDSKAAIIELKNALQKNPQSKDARFLLGKTLLESEDPVAASVELEKAKELKYANDALAPLMAKALLMQGRAKGVTDEYATASLAAPAAQADLKTTVAAAWFAQGRREEGGTALREALRVAPEYVPALLLQARLMAGGGDAKEALAQVDRLLQKAPQDADAWILKGELLTLAKADEAQTVEAYRRALALRDNDLTAHSALITLFAAKNDLKDAKAQLEALRKVRPNHPQTAFMEARIAFQAGDLKAASEHAENMLKWGGENPRVLELAGAIAARTGSLLVAEQRLNKALQIAPGLPLARLALAQVYLSSGQGPKALKTLQPMLDSKAPSAEALSLAGAAHAQSGDTTQAEEFFKRALALNPNDTRSRTALALAHLREGDGAAGFNELESIAEADPGTTADLTLIAASVQRKDIAGAMNAIDRLEKKQPDKPIAPRLRGQVLISTGDLKGARANFERPLKLDPAYFPAIESLAGLDLRDKKPADAEQRFTALLKLQPESYPGLLGLARVREAAGKSQEEVIGPIARAIKAKPSAVSARLVLIDYYLRHREPKRALSAAQDAVAAVQDNPALIEGLARSQLASGDANQAINSFTKLGALRPDSPSGLLGLADAYVAAGQTDAALDALKRALTLSPKLLEAQQKTIGIALAANRKEQALAMARTVQEQRPEQAVGYVFEGGVEAAGKNWPAATAAYRSALKREPSTKVARQLHAALHAAANKTEAAAFAAEWVKKHPQDATFIFYLGTMALADRDYAAAEAHFGKVVALMPENAIALNNLAWSAGKLHKPEALAYIEKANKIRPDEPIFLDTWSTILAEQDQPDKAIELQRKAVKLQPENGAFRLNLARLYVKAGEKALARKELEQLAQLGEKFPGQKEVQQLRSQL
jgi:putative PEP-CTERM system TPR-repeat lipoprotein